MEDLPEQAKTMLNPDTFSRPLGDLRAAFAGASPFRHVVIDDFFSADAVRELVAQFPAFEKGNFIGDDGRPGQKSTHCQVRQLGPAYAALDDLIQGDDFLSMLGELTGIPRLIYDPFYLGGGTHENRHGQDLRAHVDFNYHPSERWHRRLNLIVYLNPEWEAAWGGNLQLYADPYTQAEPSVSIEPKFNRGVIFETTEHSWHGFDRIELPPERRSLSRKSVALYFYTRERDATETAPKHTTHYVNAQLPSRFGAGHVLEESDVDLLRRLITDRDRQIRQLYEENTRLLQAQEKGLAGQLIYLGKRLWVRYRR